VGAVIDFGRRLRRLLQTDEAYEILGPDGGDWTAGGCWVLGEALTAWAGSAAGRYVVIDYGTPHHMVIRLGGLYVDGDGASTKRSLLKRWAEVEGLEKPQLEKWGKTDEAVWRGEGMSCPTDKVHALLALIRRTLGVPADRGIQPKAQAKRRNNPDAQWPEWLAESEAPTSDYLDEFSEVPDGATLLKLFDLEKQISPAFSVKRIEWTPEKISYLAGADDKPYVYERAADGAFSRQTVDDFMRDISWKNREHEYFPEDPADKFHDDFWGSPAILYHGTTALSAVLKQGLGPMSKTRGLSNRWVGAAVFTSLSDEAAASYRYGPDGGLLAIDTRAMKRDGVQPRVAQEPEVLEQELMSAIAWRLGIEDYAIEYGDSGIDPDTVIVYGKIPAKYLKDVSK
jgi:hypothetical protein